MEFPSFSLEGKVALVTGASRGIGQAIALGFAHAGADVVITALKAKERLEEVRREIEGMDRRCASYLADVRFPDQIEEVVAKAWEEMGQIDILVNNAGTIIPQLAEKVTEEAWDETLDINLKGLFFCSQAVGRRMIAAGIDGRIINVSSQMGFVSDPQHAAYCASKAGVVLLTKSLAMEWGKYKIRVNAIAPTTIRTELIDALFEDEEDLKPVIARIPLGRIGEPEETIGPAIFLASDASSLITGHTILVDGGRTTC
jgi:NAD(P)-dependent dehydrogenase (short-subunit alcohol dehydrogenase family)